MTVSCGPAVEKRDCPSVLILDNTYTFGGAINSIAHVVAAMGGAPYHPIVVSGQAEALLRSVFPYAETASVLPKLRWVDGIGFRPFQGVPGLRSGLGRRVLDGLGGAFWVARHEIPQALSYAKLGKRWSPSLVHLNNNVESQLSGVLAAWLLRVPCVAHARSFQANRRSLRLYLRGVTHHVAISTAVRDNLLELGVPPDRISIIPDGIPIDEARSQSDPESAREEFGVGPSDELFGYFGRLLPWKGVEEFLVASFQVLQERPKARAFVVGGVSDGHPAYEERLRKLVAENGLADRVVFTGFREDVFALMRMMDVVVHSSTQPEPFGMVIIEAMAVERPVVATRAGGPEDIVVEGETGHLVPPGSPPFMATAILDLLENPERAEDWGRNGLVRARERYDSTQSCAQLLGVYDRALRIRR